MDLAFDDMWSVLGLHRGGGLFLNFKIIYNAKSVFLAVVASLRWPNNVTCLHLVQVSLLAFHWSTGIGPYFPLAGGLCKFYANAGGKRTIQGQPLLVQYKQQANPL
jgi:hypothetical protein